MRNALRAALSAASFALLATPVIAQTAPELTGAPLYSYRHTGPQPGVVGSCQVISGNRICSAGPMEYGERAGPMGALVGAPVAIVTAPFGAMGWQSAPEGAIYAPATGTYPYVYESQVGPVPGVVGHCDLISGNRICMSTP